MVHIAPLPPWRRRAQRIVGILLAVLGVVVLVIALIALRQPDGHQAALHTTAVAASSSASVSAPASSSSPSSSAASSSSPAPATTSATPTPTTNPLKAIPLVVLNNTNKPGLAETAASRFTAGGWAVTSTGNLDNTIISTCAYYDPTVTNAQAAATALMAQFPAIKRVVAKFNGLPAGPIVVVLTTDYS
jgi:cytoskeletal protein RodZ